MPLNSIANLNHLGNIGVGLAAVSTSTVTLTNCNFTNNYAQEAACLYISDSSTVTSTTWYFIENTADNSAVFQSLLSGKFLDNKSIIANNTAITENSVGLFMDSTGSILSKRDFSNICLIYRWNNYKRKYARSWR